MKKTNYIIHQTEFPDDYDGKVVSTLIELPPKEESKKVILYIHGFIDYFFQDHMALKYRDLGFHFYAIDLRKYGRSILPHQKPNYCQDFDEYLTDIDWAINLIKEKHPHLNLIINAHSTGAIVALEYLQKGKFKEEIKGLFLNSPFLELNIPSPIRNILMPIVKRMGKKDRNRVLPMGFNTVYGKTLHISEKGRWDFNLDWKPIYGYPIYLAWVRAVIIAQEKIRKYPKLQIPILNMHSSKSSSTFSKSITESSFTSDIVLNVNHIDKIGKSLGINVTSVAIPNAPHDIMLGSDEVITKVFEEFHIWEKTIVY